MWNEFGQFGAYMVIINIIQLALFILTWWWLYMINKKLWEEHAWLSFVPIAQIYGFLTASKKPVLQYVVFPIIALILWAILAIITFWITLIVAYIYLMVMVIKLLHAISIRCWRWVWTTVGFVFIPFIMFPIVWYKLKENINKETKIEENEIKENNEL
jgi:hypothetical protein